MADLVVLAVVDVGVGGGGGGGGVGVERGSSVMSAVADADS